MLQYLKEEQKQEIQTSGADEVKHTKDLWARRAAFFSYHIPGVAAVSLCGLHILLDWSFYKMVMPRFARPEHLDSGSGQTDRARIWNNKKFLYYL